MAARDSRKWVEVSDEPMHRLPGLFEGASFEMIRFGNHVFIRGRGE